MKTDIKEQLNAAAFSLIHFWSTSWENEANTERNVCPVAKGGPLEVNVLQEIVHAGT